MRLAISSGTIDAPPSRRWRPPARVSARVLLAVLLLLQVEAARADDGDDQHKHARLRVHRRAAAMAEGGGGGGVCSATGSFLGVGNTNCLNDNLGAAIFLLAVIVLVSTGFERVIHYTRRAIVCPQLRRIVGRIFQEIMILGFLSMVIFALNTSGALEALSFTFDEELTKTERLHFYEFFHYVVFLTMIYFIAIVLLLLFIGTVAPKLLWESANARGISKAGHGLGRRYRLESDSEDRLDYYHHDDDDEVEDRDSKASGQCKDSFNPLSNVFDTPPASTLSDDEDGNDTTVTDRRYDVQPAHQFSWCRQDERNGMMQSFAAMRERSKSGMDLALGARAYALLLHRYQRESGWCFRLNLRKQWQLYKSFELLAYNICQHRSGYIYKNAREMKRLFDVCPPPPPCPVDMNTNDYIASCGPSPAAPAPAFTFEQYHVLCMRNLLFHMTELHPSAFVILVVISVLPSAFPGSANWIFVGVGAALLLTNVVILFKVYRILRGIVDDRLRVVSMREIQARLNRAAAKSGGGSNTQLRPRKPTFKAAALAVRAILRMQMSALCHSALHHHDHRFWFSSPKFLLRMFQFATIGQAFYLVWLSLVETQAVLQEPSAAARWYYLLVMVAPPALALFVITPMTMPSLVLVLSLTGIFAELNTESETSTCHKVDKRTAQEEAKIHMRIMRRSFLRSHYSDDEDRYIARHTFTQENVLNVEDSGINSDRGSRRSRVSTPIHPASAPAPALEFGDGAADTAEGVLSPTSTSNNVFLRIYDSPVVAVQHSKLSVADLVSPSSQRSTGDGNALLGRWRRDRGSGKYRSRPRGDFALGRSRSSSYNNDSIGSGHSYHSFDHSHSLGRSGTLPSDYIAARGGSWGRAASSRNTRSFGSFGRDQSGYSGASRRFDLAAFQATGGNPRDALNSVYHSPRRNRGRGEWSQAPMSHDSERPKSTQSQSQSQSLSLPSVGNNNNTDEGSNNPPIGDNAVLSPVATTFKSYCSKYGGYPEH